MTNILETKNLSKKLNEFLLNNINLEIASNSIIGLIGENGSGKTTLIKCILMLYKIDNGLIKFENVERCREQNDKIGVVFDENPFFNEYSINEVDKICASLFKDWDSSKFFELVNKFSVLSKKKIKNFSRGMKMKLYLAIALSHNSELLILDEATAGLDPIMRREILHILKDYAKKDNNSILISSHICSDLEAIADIIILMDKGEIKLVDYKTKLLEKYSMSNIEEKQFIKYRNYFIKYIKRDDKYCVLIDNNRKDLLKNINLLVPQLDDIAELFIRGESI